MKYNGLSVTLLPLAYLKFSTNRPLAPIVATKSSWISPSLGEILTSPFSFLLAEYVPADYSHQKPPLAGIPGFISNVHTCPLEGECQTVSNRYKADVYPGVFM